MFASFKWNSLFGSNLIGSILHVHILNPLTALSLQSS